VAHLARLGEMENTYKRLVGKAERKRTLERTGRRWALKLQCIIQEQDCKMWTACIWLMFRNIR